jgi:hypothetical protein
VPVKQAEAKKEGAQVLTGSILHNPAEEPLTLKGAMAQVGLYRLTDPEKLDADGKVVYPGAPPGGNVGWRTDDDAPEGHHWYEIGQAGVRRLIPEEFSEFVPPHVYDNGTSGGVGASRGVPSSIIDAVRAAGGGGGGGGGPVAPGGSGGGGGPGGGGPGAPGAPGGAGGGGGGRPPRGGGGGGGGGGGHGGGGEDGGSNSTLNLGNILSAVRGVGGVLGATDPDASRKGTMKAFQGLTDPEHETALRNIRAQGMLHDMIMNDPVISGHDPQEVASAFNELADVAPQFVDSPAAMQALLRKRLESGQMADFDVKQLLDMEKSRADTAKSRMETQKIERELI